MVASWHFAVCLNGKKKVICGFVWSGSALWLVVCVEMQNVRDSSWCSSPKCQIRSVGISDWKKTLHNQRPTSSLTRTGSHRFRCLCQVVVYPIIQRELERKVCTSVGDSAVRFSRQTPMTRPPMIAMLYKGRVKDTGHSSPHIQAITQTLLWLSVFKLVFRLFKVTYDRKTNKAGVSKCVYSEVSLSSSFRFSIWPLTILEQARKLLWKIVGLWRKQECCCFP